MCCLLIAGLQLLGEGLKAGGGRAARSGVGVVGYIFFFVASLGAECACSPGAECTSEAGRWLTVPGRYRHLCTVAGYQNVIN